MDSPEKILCQAHGQSRPIMDFLHENGNLLCLKVAYAVNVFTIVPILSLREKHVDG